ncbi:MAG: helix-turn-helix domain-containing protein, partial [Planctomycetota bacterium]
VLAGELAARGEPPPPRRTFEEQFADQLRLAMMRAGLGQSDLARAAGVNQTTVSRWLAAKTNPNLAQLQRVLRALGVTLDDLLGVERDAPAPLNGLLLLRGDAADEWFVFEGDALAGQWIDAIQGGAIQSVFPGARVAVGGEAERLRLIAARSRTRRDRV